MLPSKTDSAPVRLLIGLQGQQYIETAPHMRLANWLDSVTYDQRVLGELQPVLAFPPMERRAVLDSIARGRRDLDLALLLLFKRENRLIRIPGLRGLPKESRNALDCLTDFLAAVREICHELHPKVPIEQMPYGNSLHWFAAFIRMMNNEIVCKSTKYADDIRTKEEVHDKMRERIAELASGDSGSNPMPEELKLSRFPRWLIFEWGCHFADKDGMWRKAYWTGHKGFLAKYRKYADSLSGPGYARMQIKGNRLYQIRSGGRNELLANFDKQPWTHFSLPVSENFPPL
jgi:hypothetical protein